MPIRMNLNSGGGFSVPRGFPVRLVKSGESMMTGVIPRGISTVTVTLATEAGTASAHLALYTMPSSSGAGDGALLVQSDLIGLTTKAGQTLAVAVPSTPSCYVVKLWVDSITGFTADTISRDGVTATANEPTIPVGVLVSSMVVA